MFGRPLLGATNAVGTHTAVTRGVPRETVGATGWAVLAWGLAAMLFISDCGDALFDASPWATAGGIGFTMLVTDTAGVFHGEPL